MFSYNMLVTVRNEFRAQHKWEECPHDEVAFLRDWHRHAFKVTTSVYVYHNDREVEFFMLQKQVENFVHQWEGKQVEYSCEQFALEIATYLEHCGLKVERVTVSEDGENEGTIIPSHAA